MVPLPVSTDIPPGYIFVPAGVSLLGVADVEGVRTSLEAAPEHPVRVDTFSMAEREVTYADYLGFLASLTEQERSARRPHANGLDLTFDSDGVPVLTMGGVVARQGEPFCRPKRSVRRCQNWLRFPVAGIDARDAEAYTAWLARGSVPGARLCTEREWERAARGADGRRYVHGDELHPGDANVRTTYGEGLNQTGVDEVRISFPVDRSPFGILDLGGNVTEWARTDDAIRGRGGNWLGGWLLSYCASRRVHKVDRFPFVGVRVCTSAKENAVGRWTIQAKHPSAGPPSLWRGAHSHSVGHGSNGYAFDSSIGGCETQSDIEIPAAPRNALFRLGHVGIGSCPFPRASGHVFDPRRAS